jgi:predicted permease
MRNAERVFRTLLYCYPPEFRREYGGEMTCFFREQLDAAKSPLNQAAVWLRTITDLCTTAPKEHYYMILQDIRYALRTFAASPSYPAVVILSLALGIGANTAIFSLVNGVLLSELPVRDPQQLVLLSDPAAAGVQEGSSTGERALLTYAEFDSIRRKAEGFTGVMAAQSTLEHWQAQVDGRAAEEIQCRMVSADYFKVLGVPPTKGRDFASPTEPVAVISHSYWRRRFNGESSAIGAKIQVRKAVLTIVGVAPPDFYGETVGQNPDVWLPLELQPQIIPGRDWLHDKGDTRVMWLHVFGRLRPGVSMAQASGSANAVFKSTLEESLGSALSEEKRKEFLNQRLKLQEGANGVSMTRGQLSAPMLILLGVVGAVLLIACANLANLLLARGSFRQREIALRLSLGAGRGRLIRQLLTESVLLAIAGGIASLAAGYAIHGALTGMLLQSDPSFRIAFDLDPKILGFTLGLSLLTATLFGLLPALSVTRTDAALSLKEQGRGSTMSAAGVRWGKVLIGAQVALSVPLLLGAGLLLRSLSNLQQVDLGYSRNGLLLLRIEAQTAGYDNPQRLTLYPELLDRIRKTPGVKAATFSENGLFSGRDSADEILVEGYTPKGPGDRDSRWDQTGPEYFTALGVPLLQGRDFNESDRAGSLKVCIINEAFAKKFFAGRNPLGMHITTVYGDKRVTHEIVGVARDHRTHRLLGPTHPRNFVPIVQPLGETDGVTYAIRASGGDANALIPTLRKTVQSLDPNLPIQSIQSIDERLRRRTATNRMMSTFTVALGAAALLLAAIGLYGVLSYEIARRRNEIGIRMALGAQPSTVLSMILRETSWIVGSGLLIGGGIALASGNLLASQLYGVTAQDPVTLLGAAAVMLAVAFGSALFPALRASRLDPMITLRQE